jgi:cardiolipin synthase (CMP-forming)
VADAPLEPPPRRQLTAARLFGLDRSGPPPPQTRSGEPLRPWTIPNAIGYLRAALIPVFLIAAFSAGGRGGVDTLAAVAFFAVAAGDYADGIAARVTGQYSRLGALLDPVLDRLLVITGVLICWVYDLLPRWAIAVLLARELLMLVAGRRWLSAGLDIQINWPGRIAVGPTMLGIFLGLVGLRTLGALWLYAGLALALVATALYFRSGTTQLRERRQGAGPPRAAGPAGG